MSQNNKSKILRSLFKKKLVRIVGAHDGLTAKLIGESGFDGVWASGLEISASYGIPDANILTMSEYLERAIEMNEATSLPVIADCDTGYGNVNNVIHLVEKYEKAGIAAVCIEDKIFPKVNSFVEGRQELADIDEFCGKLSAVKNTQKNKDFMVIARIEALIAGWGMKEALKRANAYVESGADAILIHSKKKDKQEILEFCKKFKKKIPIVVVPTTYPNFNEREMPKLGIKLVIYANHVLRSSIKAVTETLEILNKKKQLSSIENRIVPLKRVFELQGMNILKENEKRYLKTKINNTQLVIPAAGKPPLELKKIDKFIAKSYPVSLIKVNENSILELAVQNVQKLNINKIKVISGYNSEQFDKISNIKKIKNKNFNNTNQIDSIILGLDEKLNSIIAYSDLIFEKEIIERLTSVESDISLAIDNISQNSDSFSDYVKTRNKPLRDGRILTQNRSNEILGIQKEKKFGNFEYIGICYLTKKGSKIFLDQYKKLRKKNKNFDFNYFINHLIKNKFKINAVEINGGWMEIRSENHLLRAKEILK